MLLPRTLPLLLKAVVIAFKRLKENHTYSALRGEKNNNLTILARPYLFSTNDFKQIMCILEIILHQDKESEIL